MASNAPPGVRFSEANEEIEPANEMDRAETKGSRARDDVPAEVQQELRDLSLNMQRSRLQQDRMEKFAFEPVSLPASRAASPGASSRSASRPQSTRPSPGHSPRISAAHLHSPPLTPAASQSIDEKTRKGHGSSPNLSKPEAPAVMTPQMSPPKRGRSGGASAPSSRPSSPGGPVPSPKQSPAQGRKPARFSLGPSSRSQPHSRETSPPRQATPTTGAQPTAKAEDQAGKSRKGMPSRSSSTIDPRFIFSKDSRRLSSQNVTGTTKSSGESGSEEKSTGASQRHKHSSSIFSGWYHPSDHSDEKHNDKQHGSMHDLKRFFKLGGHKKAKDPSGSKRGSKSGAATPPTRPSSQAAVPFADDHGLESKYGKFGKVLGSGAGGSVRLMKRSNDGVTFAVKQFRTRHPHESEREYNKKVTAEFCVGSTLHHGNIIETMDIVHEKGTWYEVMEYAPYDLFAIVMTGKMSREEINCCQLQILSGVTYLHNMGLAHRDLKLDNVVVNDKGILKLIDFGSAVVFRYPFETSNVRASGIVGSDPYLAPEVYDESKYDPEAVDIWSLAIIFCCMSLRRFPWKIPRLSDTSYKLFVAEPSPGTPGIDQLRRPSEAPSSGTGSNGEAANDDRSKTSSNATQENGKTSIHGPWRLLRLLPRDSRYIIARMLDTNPSTRAKLDDIWADPWVSSRPFCKQEEGGQVIKAEGHEHVLEPGAAASSTPAPSKK